MREGFKSVFIRPIPVASVLVLLIISFFGLSTSLGDIIDQRWERPENEDYDWIYFSIRNNYPIGQEFTPGMNNITGVDLCITDVNGPAGLGIAIRENTIDGTIVAACSQEFYGITSEWLHFDFGSAVSLTVGNLYVIELTMQWGSDFWTWNSWEDADGIGLPGRIIAFGNYTDTGYALGFRTYAVPEPAAILLLGVGTLLLRKKKM